MHDRFRWNAFDFGEVAGYSSCSIIVVCIAQTVTQRVARGRERDSLKALMTTDIISVTRLGYRHSRWDVPPLGENVTVLQECVCPVDQTPRPDAPICCLSCHPQPPLQQVAQLSPTNPRDALHHGKRQRFLKPSVAYVRNKRQYCVPSEDRHELVLCVVTFWPQNR